MSNDLSYFSRAVAKVAIRVPIMCAWTAHHPSGKSETIDHAELHQENVGSKDSMGASGYRNQGREERKHVDYVREEGICQPDSRV